MNKFSKLAAAVAAASAVTLSSQALAAEHYKAQVVAESVYQWTGVTMSSKDRTFVNYPTWVVPSPFKVAELVNGQEVAYPSEEANRLFTCVQSVVVDDQDRLWILDPANPQFTGVVESGAKLFQVDLNTNEIVRTYVFPAEVADKGSYLNDVRIDTVRNMAYMTNSTEGGIVVLDLGSGESWVGLDNSDPRLCANIPAIPFESTGDWTGTTHSDGIELSKDGATLFFAPMTGNVLYSVPTAMLMNKNMTPKARAMYIETVDAHSVPCDGFLLMGEKLFMGDLPVEGVRVFNLKTGKGELADIGMKVRWADTFTHDHAGNVYFTTSQINYEVPDRETYKIVKLSK